MNIVLNAIKMLIPHQVAGLMYTGDCYGMVNVQLLQVDLTASAVVATDIPYMIDLLPQEKLQDFRAFLTLSLSWGLAVTFVLKLAMRFRRRWLLLWHAKSGVV